MNLEPNYAVRYRVGKVQFAWFAHRYDAEAFHELVLDKRNGYEVVSIHEPDDLAA